MLQRKIIVQNITNLTDARYFAAWGVDYLSFNMTAESEYALPWEKIQEFITWIEGPQVLIESNSIEFLEGADGHILNTIYSSLPLNKETFFRTSIEEAEKGLPTGKYIIKVTQESIEQFKAIGEDKLSDCDLYIDVTDLSLEHIQELPDYGFVIQGGEEEKVGVKSYDDLDKLFEWLENQNY